ncbi:MULTISPECIES: DUF4394 domain-containing protein [Spirosoma]|uniref:DUF4394 domain-containing protein n=1 Tax=Spirosoma liriopis TaxID=2937440 RepID=A0ABT0HIR8_9BACT|nr:MULTISPECIES: DUF4394 domain-containing protein [Spirosoma]MCK8491480.1 DUF4394 domain-containing protein [Spirosoma liriopis]UHG90846.1 DUF4394 domain-containing protein [Spirosoma oryzicola]
MFNSKPFRILFGTLAIGSLVTLNACRDTQTQLEPASASTANARLAADYMFYVLTDNNQLLKLNTQNPGVNMGTISITGILNNERLVSIDFRPATGQLYAVSNGSRIYAINLTNGAATALGSGPFSPGINGDVVGFDFNPTVDRIRLVTNRGQNLRLNPETGAVMIVDGPINGVPNVAVSGVAYTNNRSGVTTTTLYDIDPVTDKLYRQDPPNNGTLVEVGSLGVDIAGTGSFDIAPDGSAIATLISGTTQGLYQVNLTSGRIERLGDLPGSTSIVGLAIPTEPVAYAIDRFNNLITFNPTSPGSYVSKTLTGLAPNDMIYGIDFRPANGQLYAVSNTSRLYTINTSSGAATMVGSGPFSPAITGTDVGFDFNPTVDRIRLVTSSGQNLRLNPNDGTVAAIDGTLAYTSGSGNGAITAAAYTNNFAGATSTVLYDLDSQLDRLVRQDPPNNGGLVTVGQLGVNIEGATGFDIGGSSNMAYALLRTEVQTGSSAQQVTKVYQINLGTGQATAVADFPLLARAMAVGLGF